MMHSEPESHDLRAMNFSEGVLFKKVLSGTPTVPKSVFEQTGRQSQSILLIPVNP